MLWGQPAKNALAAVHDEVLDDATCGHSAHEVFELVISVLFVRAQSALNCDRDAACRSVHLAYARSDDFGIVHECGAKDTGGDTLRGTATIEVDFGPFGVAVSYG